MNHIQNIEIKNFKSIRHQKIEDCRRVNVFIGYPNVGKSNVLEALGLYSFIQLFEERFSFNSICRINRYPDLFFNNNIKENISITLNDQFTLSFSRKEEKSDNNNEAEIDSTGNKNPFYFRVYMFQNKLPLNDQIAYLIHANVNEKFDFLGKGFSNKSRYYDDAIKNSTVSKIKYYSFSKDTVVNEKKTSSLSIPFGDNLLEILHGDPTLRLAYSEILNLYNLKLNLSDDQISIVKELSDGTFVSFQNNLVADTLRRLFFYKAAIETNKDSVLLFEEPEAHMFPPYISKFTTDIIFDKNDNQYFITTHSPFVINEFIEEVQNELAVYVVDYDKGETIIKKLTDEQVTEIAQYGIDLFFNLESYLDKYEQPHSS